MFKTIIYIDGQNFLYKVSERLIDANLISDKQDIYSFDIAGLFRPLFPDQNLEFRYYGVKKIYHNREADKENSEKAIRFSDTLRRFKNFLSKNGVSYIGKGSLKLRLGEECKNCGYMDYHFQEKGVDVGIAVDLVRDVIMKKCDRVALVSSDTDLLPALQVAKENQIPISYVCFSEQSTVSLAKVADERVALDDKKICEAYISSLNV